MHKVLIISHHFPPASDGGTVRVHSFVRYLPNCDWQPIVLTVEERYSTIFLRDEALLKEYSPETIIMRTASLEPSGRGVNELRERVYGIHNNSRLFEGFVKPFFKYINRSLAIPDELLLWLPQAIHTGLHLIREHNIEVILVTTPPHSAGIIAAILSHLSHKPLILDVRDDWVGNPHFYDAYPWSNRIISKQAEKWVVKSAHRVVSVTQESRNLFLKKYPSQSEEKFLYIPNGYDKLDILRARKMTAPKQRGCLSLVYTGGLPARRSPAHLFEALLDLQKDRELVGKLRLEFFGSARQDYIDTAREIGLGDIVHFNGFVSRLESLKQVVSSDAALLIIPEEEGSSTAIPGKVYEYLGAQKYVLALCPPKSAADSLMRDLCLGVSVPPQDTGQIKNAIKYLLELYEQNRLRVSLPPSVMELYERSFQVKTLAYILEEVTCESKHA